MSDMSTDEAKQLYEEATARGKAVWAAYRKEEEEKRKARLKKLAEGVVVVAMDPDGDEWKRTYKGET